MASEKHCVNRCERIEAFSSEDGPPKDVANKPTSQTKCALAMRLSPARAPPLHRCCYAPLPPAQFASSSLGRPRILVVRPVAFIFFFMSMDSLACADRCSRRLAGAHGCLPPTKF